MKFYHIDRSCELHKVQQINLVTVSSNSLPPYSKAGIRKMLDSLDWKVSNHGLRYLSNQFDVDKDRDGVISAQLEIIFELVRQAYFPDAISRFQAVFACKTQKELDVFSEIMSAHNTVRLDAAHYEKHDAAWLSLYTDAYFLNKTVTFYDNSIILDRAFSYWSGELTEHPRVEYLLHCPVSVLGLANK